MNTGDKSYSQLIAEQQAGDEAVLDLLQDTSVAGEKEALNSSYKHEKEREQDDHNYGIRSGFSSDLATGRRGRVVNGDEGDNPKSEEKKKDKRFKQILDLINQIERDLKLLQDLNRQLGEVNQKIETVEARLEEQYGEDWADVLGEKYGVARRPNESEEAYRKRVAQAGADAGDPNLQELNGYYDERDRLENKIKEVEARILRNQQELKARTLALDTQFIVLRTAQDEWRQIDTLESEEQAAARAQWREDHAETLGLNPLDSDEELSAQLDEQVQTLRTEVALAQEAESEFDELIESYDFEEQLHTGEIENVSLETQTLDGDFDDLYGESPVAEIDELTEHSIAANITGNFNDTATQTEQEPEPELEQNEPEEIVVNVPNNGSFDLS